MSTAEIKKELIAKIESTENYEILVEATRLLDMQLNESEELYPLTSEMESAIEESRIQIQKGQYLTHKEANKEIDEWLEK